MKGGGENGEGGEDMSVRHEWRMSPPPRAQKKRGRNRGRGEERGKVKRKGGGEKGERGRKGERRR